MRVPNGRLTLRFKLTNSTKTAVEIGGLGVPMIFNNDMNERTLDQAHHHLLVLRSIHRTRGRISPGNAIERPRSGFARHTGREDFI